MITVDGRYQRLKKIIAQEVFVSKDEERIVNPAGKDDQWLFDFRRVLLRGSVLDLAAELLWERCGEKIPFQIGGVEVAAIPLIAAFVLKAKEKDVAMNGFFCQKVTKKIRTF